MCECCNGCACREWIEEMGYDPDDSYPEDVCSRCGFEGPFYYFNEAQKYGWGGSQSMREKLDVLRSMMSRRRAGCRLNRRHFRSSASCLRIRWPFGSGQGDCC